MKILRPKSARQKESDFASRNHRENGFATIIFIALLAIMMILVMAETRALIQLRQETKFLEKQQIKRLSNSQTNSVEKIISATK